MDGLTCPHCGVTIVIESINCGIFRCGIYRSNNEQIPPHLGEEECKKLLEDRKIWGCANPFQLHQGKLIKCGWI